MKIRILSPSDRGKAQITWGDYWVKYHLEEAFLKKGYEIVNRDADLDFYLFGKYADRCTALKRFCWIYSHPDLITKHKEKWIKYATQFDHIFVLSSYFFPTLNKLSKNSSVLLGASSKELILRKEKPKYDIILLGGGNKPVEVEAIKYLVGLKKYKICLAGTTWKKALGDQISKVTFKSKYIDNEKLGEFFNSGILSFYSAQEDMRKEGFVAVRLFDIFSSSETLCISDENLGLKDVFRNIPIYKNKEDLVEKIDWFLNNPEEREKITNKCREDIKERTFKKIITEIEKYIYRG